MKTSFRLTTFQKLLFVWGMKGRHNQQFIEQSVFQYSFEKSCFSHKLFVTLSSVAVSRQQGRSRVNESFM